MNDGCWMKHGGLSWAVLAGIGMLMGASCVDGQNVIVSEDVNEAYAPLIEEGYEVVAFSVPVDDRRVHAVIALPPEDRRSPDPALLLTVGGPTTHLLPPNDLPARYFLERGYPAVSFAVGSMPGSLELYRDTVLEGPDPTLTFNKEARAVIDGCIEQGWADPDRIALSGISRYAYLAFRYAATDDRVGVVAGFSPVTDWQYLWEFDGHQSREEVAALRLTDYADQLAGKRVFMCIGGEDTRVSTESARRFSAALKDANRAQGHDAALVDFFVTSDPGHTCSDAWYERGMRTVFDATTAREGEQE